MKPIDEFITEQLVDLYKNGRTDEYGQLSKSSFDVHSLFKDKVDDAVKYGKEHNLFSVATYGGRYGTYKAIYEITDPTLKQKCAEAFSQNEWRKYNLNRW